MCYLVLILYDGTCVLQFSTQLRMLLYEFNMPDLYTSIKIISNKTVSRDAGAKSTQTRIVASNSIRMIIQGVIMLHFKNRELKLLLCFCFCFFFIQNGHSIEELARATNNQDIIEAIRRSRSTLKQEGQFIDLLSSYLQKDSDASAAKKEVGVVAVSVHNLFSTDNHQIL